MKRFFTFLLAAGILALAGAAFAADNDTIVINYSVTQINELTIADSTLTLTINGTGGAGTAPTSVTGNSTYDITTNETNRKITAGIDTAMPTGLTLSLTAAAPTGATTAGKKALTATAVDIVTGISTLNAEDNSLVFELAATAAAGTPSGSKTVTLTIVAGS